MLDEAQCRERLLRDRQAEVYDSFFPRWRMVAETECIREMLPCSSAVGIDVGSGTGRFLPQLREICAKVLAIDFSLSSHHVARSKFGSTAGGTAFIAATADRLPLAANSVDLCVAIQLFQHFPSSELRMGFVHEVKRVLKPGGRMLASCYHLNLLNRLKRDRESKSPAVLYYRRHVRTELTKMLEEGGFVQVEVKYAVLLPDSFGFVGLDKALSHTPLAPLLARTIIVRAEKPGNPALSAIGTAP